MIFLIYYSIDSILVYPDQVKSSECLSVQLWDSDRFTADDMVGKIEFDLHDLILNGGKMQSRKDKLAGEKQDSEMPGELNWEVGYFAKADFNKKLRTHGEDIRLPQESKSLKCFADVGFGRNLSSKIHKDNWIVRQSQTRFIRHLTLRFQRVLFQSSCIRS